MVELFGRVKNNTTVTKCSNYASIYGEARVGGIAGVAHTDSKITLCCNDGNIEADYIIEENQKHSVAGGIVGGSGINNFTIENCYNKGNIYGAVGKVGGILGGQLDGNVGVITIKSCYNTGNVTSGSSEAAAVGSCVGLSQKVNLTKCYSSTNLKMRGVSNGGTNTNCSANLGDSLKTYASTLGAGFKNDYGINGGYPILQWQ